jgi:Zn-dependent protease with chaperone function
MALSVAVGACATGTSQSPSGSPSSSDRAQTPQQPKTVHIDPAQATRLKQVMVPLLQAMDHPLPLNQVKVGVLDDSHINAANGGGGEFYVTTGLLQKASDDQLRAVMAHETAHADLGHVAKLQRLGAGLSLGAILLDQILPGSGAIAPIAGFAFE